MRTRIAIETFEAAAARKRARALKLDRGEHLASEKRITFEWAEEFLSCITPKRVQLCEAVRRKPCSITELAGVLQRDRKSVYRDVAVLSEIGMLNLKKERNPGHGQVRIVEATARTFQLVAEV